jgi:hypothetical protein
VRLNKEFTVPHSASIALLLLACATNPVQLTCQERANLPRSFHDDALNITYFYPAHFAPVTNLPVVGGAIANECAETTLIAESAAKAGPSSFVLSKIEPACPGPLRKASALGPFTRVQLMRQLEPFGEARISHETTQYLIDGRPAAITLGSVSTSAADHGAGKTIYAAKACALSDIPNGSHHKSDPANSGGRVLCFDFSTENSDLISLMFAFVVQFNNDPPAPLFPASVHPSYWATGGRKPN